MIKLVAHRLWWHEEEVTDEIGNGRDREGGERVKMRKKKQRRRTPRTLCSVHSLSFRLQGSERALHEKIIQYGIPLSFLLASAISRACRCSRFLANSST